MPSGKNFIATVAIVATVYAILIWMDKTDQDITEISLVKACRQGGFSEPDCEAFEDHNMDWDTKTPCNPMFKADQYYFTPRMVYNALQRGNDTYSGSMLTAYQSACGGLKQDSDWAAFKAGNVQGRSQKRDLIEPVSAVIAGIILVLLAGTGIFTNYKACSTKLGLTAVPFGVFENINDSAQCSDKRKQPTKCKKFSGFGTGGWWYRYHRGSKNYLNNGCVDHDNCLWDSRCEDGCYDRDGNLSTRDECDQQLADAATDCRDAGAYGWANRNGCKDAGFYAAIVEGVMNDCPNCGKGYSNAYDCGDWACPTGDCNGRVRVLVDGEWVHRQLGGSGAPGGCGGR